MSYTNYRNTTVLEAALTPLNKAGVPILATFDQNPLILNVDVGQNPCLTRPPVYYPTDLLKQAAMTLGGMRPAPVYVGKRCPPVSQFC
jgi:hypothetical protein